MLCTKPRQEAILSRLRAAGKSDRGDVTSSLIMMPIVLFAILVGIHFSLVLHGRNVATAAAQDALHAAQLENATAGNGQAAGQNTLALFGGIRDSSVQVNKSSTIVTVTVRGTIAAPISGLFNDFEVTRSGPIETFYYEDERD